MDALFVINAVFHTGQIVQDQDNGDKNHHQTGRQTDGANRGHAGRIDVAVLFLIAFEPESHQGIAPNGRLQNNGCYGSAGNP